MNAMKAVELWMQGRMTVDEVMSETGCETKSQLMSEYLHDQYDFEISSMRFTQEEQEDKEVTRLAWDLYQSLLAENPDWLPQIVAGLKEKKQRDDAAFGSAINAAYRSQRGNVIDFPHG
ncbi:hypothetical protein [Rhizobium sp. L245/93]|uniref:hypothetical protein n=1 Tax=Rhizobium sp. L245/93 TaxID=2819998 RepID=UPI001ADB0579|nr:hypothetical protein [Rhizobium sp. L245/93]MBO9170900.1 hypothetical protein [Rhizobium sp. L245/93]